PQPPRRRWRTGLVAALKAVVLVDGGIASWHGTRTGDTGSPSLTWAAAQAPLPADAPAGGGPYSWTLEDVTCAATGSCVAVGSYSNTGSGAGAEKPLIETLADGTWSASDDVAGAGLSSLSWVDCTAPSSCVAVGDSLTGQYVPSPVAATLSA